MTFDFAVLGDNQPEGLLVASSLARKGFSVGLVPSMSLGELHTDDFLPLHLPSQAAGKKLDDLLFRAGFFRLEDSGLVSAVSQQQYIFPRNRLNLEGTSDHWLSEIRREFPLSAKSFEKILTDVKRQGFSKASVARAASEMLDLEKRDPSFSRFVRTHLQNNLSPQNPVADSKPALKFWLDLLLNQGGKVYRVDPKLKGTYSQFLVEHARKWGVQVVHEAFDLKPGLSAFQLSADLKSKHVIINSLGGSRAVAKVSKTHGLDRIKAWLYYDRMEVSLDSIPEPLQEFCWLDFDGTPHLLFLRRDHLRNEAVLTFGSWLPFEDSKVWVSEIEKGRQLLLKFLPYLSKTNFRQIPSLLELTEMRGECVRRGQIERLQTIARAPKKLQSLMRRISGRVLGSKVYSVNPGDLPYRSRLASFGASLSLLDHFDERRSKLRPNAIF